MKKLSFIVPSFNKKKYIGDTIDSILNQTYKNIELIIIDDYSTDGTRDFLIDFKSEYLSDKRIIIELLEQNRGANYCRNLGIKKASGDYIVFIDADDLIVSDCAEKRVEVFLKNPSLDFAIFSMGVFKNKIGDTNGKWLPTSKNPLIDFLQHKLPWSIIQPVWNKNFLIKLDGFDLEFTRLQDVEFHTRVLFESNIKYLVFAERTDCYYRTDEQRINGSVEQFLKKHIDSISMYYKKYFPLAKAKGIEKYMLGTIFQGYTYLMAYYKNGKLTDSQFKALEKQLLSDVTDNKKNLFMLGRFFNITFPFRIKGVNFLLRKLLYFSIF